MSTLTHLFNIFLERIMTDALEDHEGTFINGGRTITNLCFANDIDGLAEKKEKLAKLTQRLDKASISYGMEISAVNDNEIEKFYNQLQNVIDRTPKKDILVVQRDWNAKVGRDACGNWQGMCGPFCNDD